MNRTTRLLFSDMDAARAHLAPAMSAKVDHAGRYSLDQLIRDGAAFRVVDEEGRHVAAYVVQPFGRALWITAAVGTAGFPLCPVIADHAAQQARQGGFAAVAFRTERRGLVAKARRLGFDVVRQVERAYYMSKEIQ